MAYDACESATPASIAEGSVGAGTGATVGKAAGIAGAMKGGVGIGTASSGDVRVGAVAVVNALGDVRNATGEIIAGARDATGRFIDGARLIAEGAVRRKFDEAALQNTTIAVVATTACLARVELSQLAQASSAALFRRITPTGTSFDGDVIFAICPLDGPAGSAASSRGPGGCRAEAGGGASCDAAVGRDGIPGAGGRRRRAMSDTGRGDALGGRAACMPNRVCRARRSPSGWRVTRSPFSRPTATGCVCAAKTITRAGCTAATSSDRIRAREWRSPIVVVRLYGARRRIGGVAAAAPRRLGARRARPSWPARRSMRRHGRVCSRVRRPQLPPRPSIGLRVRPTSGAAWRRGAPIAPGIVQTTFWLHGVTLPRDAWQQAAVGEDAGTDLARWGPADLIFFSDRDDRRITHVGIALGESRMAHVALGRGGHAVERLDGRNDSYVTTLCRGSLGRAESSSGLFTSAVAFFCRGG